MQNGSECKGKVYKYCDGILPPFPDPRLTYIRDRDARAKLLKVDDGHVVFDFGAEYGYWTLAALAQGARMVYTIEVDPVYIAAIRENLHINTNFFERCNVIRRPIRLDEYINDLSIRPQRIDYIRLPEIDPPALSHWMAGAMATLIEYKPKVIICLGQAITYEEVQRAFSEFFSCITKHLVCNENSYCLVSFK